MREAVVHVPHDALETGVFGEVVALAREAGLRDLSEVVCRAPGCILVITVESRMDESAVADHETVAWLERIEETAESVVYLCEVRPDTDSAVTNREISVDDRGVELSLVGPQSAIAEALAEFDTQPTLERLGDYEGPTDPLDALTERQHEVVETAHEMGYYDVPRAATTAEVASALEVDPSTVTEHLQRAERNLFDGLLGDG